MCSDPTMTTDSCGDTGTYVGIRHSLQTHVYLGKLAMLISPAHHRELSSAEPYMDRAICSRYFYGLATEILRTGTAETYRRQEHSPVLGIVEHRGSLWRGHMRRHPVGRPLRRLIRHVLPAAGTSSSSSPCREIVVAMAR